MTVTSDFFPRWHRHKTIIAKANSLNKEVVFGALATAGITQVGVTFDGEGDSGQIEFIGALSGDQQVEFPATTVTLQRAPFGSEELTAHETPLREAVGELCYCN
jgi:hypothetical protein